MLLRVFIMEPSDILVSAIVSVYNAERFIAGCLEDLERQSIAGRLEIIVVDTGSPQLEGEIVRSYQNRFSNIRYIRIEERETIYQAWNRAIAVAQGRYLTNANADDRHHPEALERLVNVMENNPVTGVVYANSFVTNVENDIWPSDNITGVFYWPMYEPRLLFQICFVGPQPMWRRALHATHGLFDGSFRSAGDYEFWLRLSVGGVQFVHLPEILGLYLASPLGMELSNQTLSNVETEKARCLHWPKRWGLLPPSSTSFLFPSLDPAPLVSVVIATQNRPYLLKDALLSLNNQAYQNWEAIVVNDGGANVESVISAIDHDGRIKLMNHWQCLGQVRARNTALRVVQGQIICYLDDDDNYMPNHIEGIVKTMRNSASPFVFTGAIKVTEYLEGDRRIEISRVDIDDALRLPQNRLLASNFIPLPNWAHRRECIKHTGYFDEQMSSHEDWEFILRFASRWELLRIEQTTVEIRIRPTANDSVTTRNNTAKVRDYKYIYQKHPTNNKQINSMRRAELSELGEQPTGLTERLSRRLNRLLNKHILWRFNAHSRPKQ